ncbi:MAG: tetratricopeptide repeat protein [Myxococcota bacterium]
MNVVRPTYNELARLAIVALLASCLAGAGCASPTSADGGSQGEAAEKQLAEAGALRVRVWADAHYRRDHEAWRDHVERQLRLVNDTLDEELGARLIVTEMREWNPEAGPNDLDALLGELESSDRATDVDLVVGLTEALPFGARSQRRLGYSSLLGKHMLVRGVDPTSDLDALRTALPDASEADLRQEAELRASHRERTTLMHEMGHILGAVHTVSEDWLMSPVYRNRQRGFSPENTRILKTSIALLRQAENHDAWKREVAGAVEGWIDGAGGSFIPKDAAQVHQHMLALLEPDSLTRNEARIFNQSQDVAQTGDFQRALELIEPLLERRPNHPMVISAVCQFHARLEMRGEASVRVCARAMEARPEDPLPGLFLAHIHVDRGEVGAAMETMRRVEVRLERDSQPHPRDYLVLAVLYQRTGALAHAEDAARRAGEMDGARQVLDWARKLRRTWGLPRGTVPLELEYLVAEKLREFDQHLSADQFEAATYVAERLAQEFPRSAAAEVASCRLLTARGDMRAAVPHCRRAIARDPSAAMAHYVLGVWEMNQGRYNDANRHLSRAVSLTPSARGFWRSLGVLYRKTGSADAYRSVAEDYRERFGEALPE